MEIFMKVNGRTMHHMDMLVLLFALCICVIVALLYTQGTEKDTAYQKNYYVGEFCDDKRHGKGLLFDLKDKSFTATVRYKHGKLKQHSPSKDPAYYNNQLPLPDKV